MIPGCFLFSIQGLPFPDQEFSAADVVVRYAVTELGFAFEDIILYAWSIGDSSLLVSLAVGVRVGCVFLSLSQGATLPRA